MGVAAIWGSSFVIMADAITRYPMLAFLSLRFGIATVVLSLIMRGSLKKINRVNLRLGLPASVFLTAGYILQTASLVPAAQGGTTPARSAFLTGMYVILVPVIQSIIKRKFPQRGVVLGVIFALGGLWALSGLSLSGGGLTDWVRGDTLVFLSAVCWSTHMILLGTTTEKHDAPALAIIQMAVLTLISGLGSLIIGEHAGVPQGWQVWTALLITSVFCSALAYTAQTWVQTKIPASRVALILVLEPAFGGVVGWLAAGVVVLREAFGAALLILGMIFSETLASKKAEPEVMLQ